MITYQRFPKHVQPGARGERLYATIMKAAAAIIVQVHRGAIVRRMAAAEIVNSNKPIRNTKKVKTESGSASGRALIRNNGAAMNSQATRDHNAATVKIKVISVFLVIFMR